MTKPYGRQTKKQVGRILMVEDREAAMERLGLIPDKQLVGPLFSFFYHGDDRIRFRSTAAMGVLAARMGQTGLEKSRIILRRIMWNLNDESGGIGWGSCEAMGEILSLNPELAKEFKSILFSYLDPRGNFLEHEMLQRGVIWGIGTFFKAFPRDLDERTKDLLHQHLYSVDPVKRAYALRALANANGVDSRRMPESMATDSHTVNIFDGWALEHMHISDLCTACTNGKTVTRRSVWHAN